MGLKAVTNHIFANEPVMGLKAVTNHIFANEPAERRREAGEAAAL